MMRENGSLVVGPRVIALTSVSLIGGQSVTVNLAAISLCDGFATGDCPTAGTGISCCTVTAAGAGCECVTNNLQLHSCRIWLTVLG